MRPLILLRAVQATAWQQRRGGSRPRFHHRRCGRGGGAGRLVTRRGPAPPPRVRAACGSSGGRACRPPTRWPAGAAPGPKRSVVAVIRGGPGRAARCCRRGDLPLRGPALAGADARPWVCALWGRRRGLRSRVATYIAIDAPGPLLGLHLTNLELAPYLGPVPRPRPSSSTWTSPGAGTRPNAGTRRSSPPNRKPWLRAERLPRPGAARRVRVEQLNGQLLGARWRRAPLQAREPVRTVAGELAREPARLKVRAGNGERDAISLTGTAHLRASASGQLVQGNPGCHRGLMTIHRFELAGRGRGRQRLRSPAVSLREDATGGRHAAIDSVGGDRAGQRDRRAGGGPPIRTNLPGTVWW